MTTAVHSYPSYKPSGNDPFYAQKAYLGVIQATGLEHIIDLITIYYLS